MNNQQPPMPSGMSPSQPNGNGVLSSAPQPPSVFHAPNLPASAAFPLPQAPQPLVQTMPLPQPVPPPGVANTAPHAISPHTGAVAGQSPAIKEDDSELDELWINKAREIVKKTQYDPYLQSLELSKVKAGYLKSRYDIEIKLNEDRPK